MPNLAPASLLRSLLWPALLGLAGCDTSYGTTDQRLSATGEVIAMSGGAGGAANACFTCHGLDGGGDGISVPRLAGLDLGYLQKQMEDYASGLRADPVMTPIARSLSQQDRNRVAAYYASMPAPQTDQASETVRPLIWTRGDAERGIPSCASCHGSDGQGAGGQPAVARQPAAYTIEQIARFQSGERRNDPRGVMATAAHALTPDQTQAIADWLAAVPLRPPEKDIQPDQTAVAKPAGTREIRRPERSDGG